MRLDRQGRGQRPRTHRVAALVAGASFFLAGAGAFALPVAAAEEERVLVVLDSSGSMQADAVDADSRMDAGREATVSVLNDLPEGSRAGLMVYGATVHNRNQPGACTDAEMVYSPATASPGQVSARLDAYSPYGESPLAHALTEAARQAGATQTDRILLVSDGWDTCGQDPCQTARTIGTEHPGLQIDVIGFRPPEERETLRCVAQATGGSYREADSISRSSQRTFPWQRDRTSDDTGVRAPDSSGTGAPRPGSQATESNARAGLMFAVVLLLLGWLGSSFRKK